MLSTPETTALERGQTLKRVVRAAAALHGLFDDSAIADAVGMRRGAVAGWWEGAHMRPETIAELSAVTGLSFSELTSFVYLGGPPPQLPASGPSGLQEGVRRAREHLAGEDPDMPAQLPGRRPHDDVAGRG